MQILIDIPEEIYDSACSANNIWDMRTAGFVCSAIANGIPLPKGHGNMSEEELTEWENRPDVIRVLTSYEMRAWLYRRERMLLQEICDKIDARREELKTMADNDWYAGKMRGYDCTIEIIDKYKKVIEGYTPFTSDAMRDFRKKSKTDVLDKIRAEIEQMDFDFGDYYDHTDEIIEMVCKVIDKHKAESEEQA